MTISDATPHNWPAGHSPSTQPALIGLEAPTSSVTFTIGPENTPAEAIKGATTMTAMALPTFLGDAPRAAGVCADVEAVLIELVDITARHRASDSITGQVLYDGSHVTVSVGDMDCRLPAPEEEPGLYLVHGLASEVGQYAGDHGGRVTWAAVAA